jgi:hypothetical protein
MHLKCELSSKIHKKSKRRFMVTLKGKMCICFQNCKLWFLANKCCCMHIFQRLRLHIEYSKMQGNSAEMRKKVGIDLQNEHALISLGSCKE